jgi:ABC-type sugar transport system substrate-binding protein
MTMSHENLISVVGASRLTRRRFVFVGAAGSVAVLTGGLNPALAADKPKVGLVMKSLANEFFKQMQAGADKYAAKNADKFDFKAVGMKDERDFAAQVDAIENFVTQKYNVIVVAPADSKAMVTPIAKAIKEGVKVINIDVELDQDAKKAAGIDLAFFGPDNRAGAKMAGDALAKALGPGGKVAESLEDLASAPDHNFVIPASLRTLGRTRLFFALPFSLVIRASSLPTSSVSRSRVSLPRLQLPLIPLSSLEAAFAAGF